MTPNAIRVLAVAGAVLVLGACGGPPSLGPGEATFGNAVLHNIAAQTVNPEPALPGGIDTLNGARAAGVVERYETGTVTQPAEISTQDVITSGD